MSQSNALGFRNQSEHTTVTIKTPRSTLLNNFQSRFVMAIDQLIGYFAVMCFIGELKCFRAKPLDTNNSNRSIRHDSSKSRVGL